MGDLFSTKKNQQTTQNQQVGVSGSGAGLSGTIGGSQAAQNATATGNISAAARSTVNIVSSDLAAIQAMQAVSTGATNAGLLTSIHALDVVQSTQTNAASLIAQVQAGANDVALRATPVSAGEVSLATTAALKPLLISALVVAGIVALVIVIKK